MTFIPADEIANVLVEALRYSFRASRAVRVIFLSSACLMILGFGVLFFSYSKSDKLLSEAGLIILAFGFAVMFCIGIYAQAKKLTEKETAIQAAEQIAREHPDEPKYAWDLARINLEKYINRNLGQIKSIYWLTLGIMIAGFVIIGYGVHQAYKGEQFLTASILVTVSGIIVEFIAATFLVVYKSTMEQAKGYVTMLEKINGVGMAIQIMDGLPAGEPKDKLRADLALKMLALYEVK